MIVVEKELSGVCAKQLKAVVSPEKIIMKIDLLGGCDGQRQVLNACSGMTVDEFARRFGFIRCGHHGTSCAAEVAKALADAVGGVEYDVED